MYIFITIQACISNFCFGLRVEKIGIQFSTLQRHAATIFLTINTFICHSISIKPLMAHKEMLKTWSEDLFTYISVVYNVWLFCFQWKQVKVTTPRNKVEMRFPQKRLKF